MNTREIRFHSNRVCDILALMRDDLTPLYGEGEVRAFAEILFEAFLGWDRVRLLTSKQATIDQSDLLRFHWAIEDLKRYRPIQHIVGYSTFAGCRIEVDPTVLIPRPETEQLLFHALRLCPTAAPTAADICTGSGCIAIAIKHHLPQASVTGIDISAAAIERARRNAALNQAEVHFVLADVLAGGAEAVPMCHLITANPPYIRRTEAAQMQRNVLDYEPELALFVPDDDPLLFYRALAAVAQQRLLPGGVMMLEINEAFGNEVTQLLEARGFKAEVLTDFRNKPRIVCATRG